MSFLNSYALYFYFGIFLCKWMTYSLFQISTQISTVLDFTLISTEGKVVGAKSNLMDRHIKSQQIQFNIV